MGQTQLLLATGLEEQWSAIVQPWLEKHARIAWRDVCPTVVLTPGRAESFYLRSRLVEAGVSFLGLRFWTPSDARSFLQGRIPLGVEVASRAELQLVARVCAAKVALASHEPSLASIEREPGPFLSAYDLLIESGWNPAEEGPAYARELAREMTRTLKGRSLATQAELHRLLRQRSAGEKEPLLSRLLVVGFNATHWPLWDLLRAVVHSSEDTVLSFLAPREFGESVDQLWIGSWEEEEGVSAEFAAGEMEAESPFSGFVAAYEKGSTARAKSCPLSFLAGSSLRDQVQATVLQALTYLKSDSCRRLGIIFPDPNALALGVAQELRRLGVPIDDGTGFLQPGRFESRAWLTWLALQDEPSVRTLIDWVRACEADVVESPVPVPARVVAELLEEALGETLIDDLDFLSRHLREISRRALARETADFLRAQVQLPASGKFSEFLELTRRAGEGWIPLGEVTAPEWLKEAEWTLSRRAFLGWLKEATRWQERTRGPEGNHFYGKVHLLIYAQMPGQTWTHLILTGLNEGRWPRPFEAGAYGSQRELAELNGQARALNRRVARQGSQGAGHEAVRADRGYCLLPMERQDLALRDLCTALEATREAVCLTGTTAEGGRSLLPSDFLSAAYQAKMGAILDEEAWAGLAKSTGAWAQKNRGRLERISERDVKQEVAATRTAYAARREAGRAFGPYEFAWAEPPPEPIQLACKTWEEAWQHPASVWLGKIVGVSAWAEGELAWPRAMGTWVHRWLATAFRAAREGGDFMAALKAAAEEGRKEVLARAGQAGVEMYPWWNHVWGQARARALALGAGVAPHLAERAVLSEYRLPGRRVALPGTQHSDFELRGQIDLLLLEPGSPGFDPETGDFSQASGWVIDFKTGASGNLTAGKLEKGEGLQAMLYALAVRAAGAEAVAVSLQTYDTPLKPQVQIEQIEANVGLFRSLDRLHRAGVFGMRPEAESEHGFSPLYPMATRPIARGVLEAKWALSHGATFLPEGA